MPDTPGDFHTTVSYAWDSRVVRAVSSLASSKLAPSVRSHSYVKANVKNSDRNVHEVLVDEDVPAKEIAVRSLDLESYSLGKVLFISFQIHKV